MAGWSPSFQRAARTALANKPGAAPLAVSNPAALSAADFPYLGTFAMPGNDINGMNPGSGCQAAAFNAANNSIFINAQDGAFQAGRGFVAEMLIPPQGNWVMGNSPSGGSTNLAAVIAAGRATYLQPFTDMTGGLFDGDAILGAPAVHGRVGGLVIAPDGHLIMNVYNYYGGASKSHLVRHGLNLAVNDAIAWQSAWDPVLQARFVTDGYTSENAIFAAVRFATGNMIAVPAALQASFGGTVICGKWVLAGDSSMASYGPLATCFDASLLGSGTPSSNSGNPSSSPISAKTWVGYPLMHETLGAWGGDGTGGDGVPPQKGGASSLHTWYSWMDQPGGMFFVKNFLVWPMTYGIGHATNPNHGGAGIPGDEITNYYGSPTPSGDWPLNGTNIGGGDPDYYGYDPTQSTGGRGPMGFPYKPRMVAAKTSTILGATNPWDVVPDVQFDFAIPFDYAVAGGATQPNVTSSFAAAHDSAGKKLYLIQRNSNDYPGGPLAHVYGTP